jgi:hypothetical protein
MHFGELLTLLEIRKVVERDRKKKTRKPHRDSRKGVPKNEICDGRGLKTSSTNTRSNTSDKFHKMEDRKASRIKRPRSYEQENKLEQRFESPKSADISP